jgi:hypothetical protein
MNLLAMEKRRHLRLAVDVKYRLFIDNGEYAGHINNISSSGAYLATIDPKLPGSCVSRQGVLNLNVDEENWVSAKCEIVYVGHSANESFAQGAGVALLW